MMRNLVVMGLLLMAAPALADPPAWKEAEKERREAEREWRKDEQERAREQAKDEREWAKERRKDEKEWAREQREEQREWAKAEREWRKEERKAWRELQKERRKAAREAARDGWYDGERWRGYDEPRRYRNEDWVALRRYAAPVEWRPPTPDRVVVFEPGMRLPDPWYVERYHIVADPYGLPPPPPRHAWVQVDDDAVLVALASGLVADFVYDLFE